MNLPDYEYKGLIAQAWDVLRGDTSTWPDRFFYLELIQRFGQPVLDVGYGRAGWAARTHRCLRPCARKHCTGLSAGA